MTTGFQKLRRDTVDRGVGCSVWGQQGQWPCEAAALALSKANTKLQEFQDQGTGQESRRGGQRSWG